MTANITCAGCTHAYADTALFCPNCGRPKVREFGNDVLLGKVLGERFQVQELLGQGGSGTIYRAEHITLRRRVAIKVLHNELSRDDLAVERFRREATTVAEIDNEHIVEIHDFGRTPDGRLYLAMELLEGETLDAVLAREGTLSVERTADILIQVGEALMEAHAIGYVHRDLRPRNVYLAVRRGKANFVKLLDFGLSKLVETDASAASTSLGMTFGDPRYMSPEQARGDRIDRRADIYQLGCVAYEMLTGAPPFGGSRVFDILTKQVTEAPQPLPSRRRDVPLWLEAAVTKMLAKDPENRFATTTRMVEALRRGLDTGEVMEDELARRRESIPPPSVSRVMNRMGLEAPADPPAPAFDGSKTVRGHADLAAAVTVPVPAVPSAAVPSAAVPSAAVPAAAVPTSPSPSASSPALAAPIGAVPAPPRPPINAPRVTAPAAPVDSGAHQSTSIGSAPAPVVAAPVPTPPVLPGSSAEPDAGETQPNAAAQTRQGLGVKPEPIKPDSVELLRKRTGTPRLGVPIGPVTAPAAAPAVPEDPTQAPVAGVIDRPAPAVDPSAVSSAKKRGEAEAISQVWYEDEDEISRVRRKKPITASTTDLYDELPRRRRWGLLVGGAAVLLAGGVALAVSLRGGGNRAATRTPDPAVATAPATPAPPSTIIEPPAAGSADAAGSAAPAADSAPPAPAPAPANPAVAKADPPRTGRPPATTGAPAPPAPAPTTGRRPLDDLSFPTTSEPVFRRPGGGSAAPTPPPGGGSAAPVVGPSGTDAPQDPYGTPEAPAAAPEKQAEFFANLGAQQVAAGDAAGAAASFKKALELDPKSAVATMGMGEIALRQGLFGDALTHLQKAARLAPRSPRVFVLLGEAHLALGKNPDAAANFKKALQLDPDNARARDGYNEASSRVPPPTDE